MALTMECFVGTPEFYKKLDNEKYQYVECNCTYYTMDGSYLLRIPRNKDGYVHVYPFKCVKCGLKGRLYAK